MDFFEVVKKRYSHKAAFKRDVIPSDEDLRRIAEAGIAAPSAGNNQSPEFVIINDDALVDRIGEISQRVPLQTAPRMIALVSDPKAGCHLENYAVATGYMLLAATALGYSCGWVDGPFLNPAVRDPVSELLGLPDDRLLIVIVPVGLPAEPGPRRPKKPFERRASWNRYAVVREE
jgi:nitroreductase